MTRARGVLALAAGVMSLEVACSAKLSLEGRYCPCVAGWFCCNETDQCVPEGEDEATCAQYSGGVSASKKGTSANGDDDDETASSQTLGGADVRCFATDDDAIYWMSSSGRIDAFRTTDGPGVTLESFPLPADAVLRCAMARSGDDLYVTLEGAGSVLRLSVTKDPAGGIRLGARAERLGQLTRPTALAVTGADLYVAEHESREIKRVDAAATTLFATAGANVSELAVSGDDLVWAHAEGVTARSRAGGPTRELTTDSATNLTVDGGAIYYLADRQVHSLAAGAPSTLDELRGARCFAFDGEHLYYAKGGTLWRATKRGEGNVHQVSLGADDACQLHADAKRFVWLTARGLELARR